MAGQLRVDEITDEAGTGSPSFPFGLPVGYAAGGTAPAAGSFTEVPDDVLEPGDPIRSVDILAIKNNTLFLFDSVIGFPIIDQQRFDASGNWTKPNISTPEAATVIAVLVGGGGAGGSCNVSHGNGSGGGGTGGIAISAFGFIQASNATTTIGAGGAGASASAGNRSTGNAGGGSSIVMTDGTLTAGGGGGGAITTTNVFEGKLIGGLGGVGGNVSATGLWEVPVINRSKNGRASGTGGSPTVNTDFTVTTAQPVFGGGGAFATLPGTTFTQNSAGGPAFALSLLNNEPFVGAGGTGSNTSAGNGGAFGAGGGGAAAANTGTVTSGSGAQGGALIFVVRGIVSANVFESKQLQIP